MAYNAASHNIPGERTGPISGQPPPASDETKAALLDASKQDPAGQSAPGQDGGEKDVGQKVKSEKELAKERAKDEKLRKFQEKQAKLKTAPSTKPKESKKPKAEVEVIPEYIEETPKGQKKILKPLDDVHRKAYIPKVVESAWNDWWEKEGYFQPEYIDNKVKPAGYFVIPIPPPNVTGALHIGHALANSLQDALIRWHRMQGFTTLFVPGCDHAGISTQSVVENILWRREQKTRHDLGRPELVRRIWEWKGDYHNRINHVLRRLGGSYDWTREAFTMDENLSAAVMETFCRLHDEGLIYRANRLVNWCTKLQTALSNLEVDNKEIEGRTLMDVPGYDRKVEFGVLTFFRYPIDGSDEFITIATTRPETMLGDSGIAVHPDDDRYKHLIGKFAKHPFVDRLLPIFADTYVELGFGTGAVKITPAHDPNDFELGKKHKLEFINILTNDGFMNENTGSFKGQKRFDARYNVIAELKKLNLYDKWENNAMKIPLCNKSKDVIEPYLKPQWWMKMKGMAEQALAAVDDGRIKIRPETADRSYHRWLEGINDWCLSRQLWWGHQIPAYFIQMEGEAGDEANDASWVTAHTKEEAQKKAEAKFPGKKITLTRDPDVLDTWFSSGLWPFSTLGWPKKTLDLDNLFPTSVLETGWDILFFWVARMIMLSLKLTGEVPFKEVYCHSLVRDSEGRKMSKSLGNVIDPIDVMEGITLDKLNDKLHAGNLDPKELVTATKYQKTAFPQGIPECGSDALRFSLIQYTTGGGDIAFDVKVMHGYRRFCNKIYQATKYVLGSFEKYDANFVPQDAAKKTGKESLPERWILSRFNNAVAGVNEALTDREFSRSTQILYNYFYDELCDVYIENSKAIISDGTDEERRSAVETLYTCLEGALRLIHPFMPFLSEELWQRLPKRPGDKTPSITIAAYPKFDNELQDRESEEAYELILECSKGVRSLIAEYKIEGAKAYIHTTDTKTHKTASSQLQPIKSLSGKSISSIIVLSPTDAIPTGSAVYAVSTTAAVYLDVQGHVNIDEEISKAQQKMKKASDSAVKQRKLIESEEFKEKVSAAVQAEERKKLEEFEAVEGNYERTIAQFQTLKLEAAKE
ncbi:valyl-tRNA synthetase-like protein [Tothia fuscella]|uniref:Valine--tRNA ligase, mitochondrial n=1 Tax=Tothia fuscella TaxID=1048955 RepID=A0A9P4NEN5_9PEZI|nr:valyl-tRNA synthetase-like protein [Tothia fuscella]